MTMPDPAETKPNPLSLGRAAGSKSERIEADRASTGRPHELPPVQAACGGTGR